MDRAAKKPNLICQDFELELTRIFGPIPLGEYGMQKAVLPGGTPLKGRLQAGQEAVVGEKRNPLSR